MAGASEEKSGSDDASTEAVTTLPGVGAAATAPGAEAATTKPTTTQPKTTQPKATQPAATKAKTTPAKATPSKAKGTLVGVGSVKKVPKVPRLSGPAVVSSRKPPKGLFARPPVAPPPSRKLPPLPSDAPPALSQHEGSSGEAAALANAPIPPPANVPSMGDVAAGSVAPAMNHTKASGPPIPWLWVGGALVVIALLMGTALIAVLAAVFSSDEPAGLEESAPVAVAEGTEALGSGPPANQLDPESPIEDEAEAPLPEPRTLTAEEQSRFDELREGARNHFSEGRFDEAAAAYRAATDIDPAHPGSFAGLGAALSQGGDFTGAVAAYEVAVQLSPDSSGYHAALGRVLRDAGNDGRAREEYRRAVELAPDNRAARRALRELESE